MEPEGPLSEPWLFGLWIALSLGAILVATSLVARPFLQVVKIPSRAMLPTLEEGDRVVVDKRPLTVRRGDVIMFKYPLDRSTTYVKRVIATGGDVFEVAHGHVYVNGAVLPRETIRARCPMGSDGIRRYERNAPCALSRETIGEHSYLIGTELTDGEADYPRTLVPKDKLFVLGDNRDNSADSRVWGTVPLSDVVGIVPWILWSSAASGARWAPIDANASEGVASP